ncbi:class I SAM-dependent methyltransferase [Kibdelosporangium lantanae]
MFDYDAELHRYHQRLVEAIAVRPDDTVLDIGCGAGLTTRTAAGIANSVLGVDISAEMLSLARARTDLANVRFVEADVQVHPFPPAHFSLAISRFGTMFFDDPAAAFANIARALRPGGRFVQLVWQPSDQQEWVRAIRQAVTGEENPVLVDSAFSLGNPIEVEGVLTAAGFADVRVEEVSEQIFYGLDPDAAVVSVRSLSMAGGGDEHALDRLRSVMAAHQTADGVWFDSAAWIVTASVPPGPGD